jgi:broad specificity phosphatase PhoE
MLVLVRHGEATANAAGLLLGRSDVPLTERGRAQVAALRAHVGPVVAIVSSPLRRARDTAEGLATGREVVVDDRWVELDYGEHEGERLGAVPADVWQRWRADPGYRPAGGESLSDVGSRVRGACEALFATAGAGARDDHGDVVVVSHVSPIKAAVAWALGVGDATAWRLHLSTGSITRIGWGSAGIPVLHCYNWQP